MSAVDYATEQLFVGPSVKNLKSSISASNPGRNPETLPGKP